MEIKEVLSKYYGIDEADLIYLEGFEDKTYKVEVAESKFIFKEYRYSKEAHAAIESESGILEKLSGISNFNFPEVIPTSANEPYVVKGNSIFRLLSFLDGELLGDADHSDQLLRNLGSLLGSMDRCLSESFDPVLMSRDLEWDLQYLKKNLPYLKYIEDPSDRSLVSYFFQQYNEHVLPTTHQLRKSVIHNDANDWNIVIGNKALGIFDFGDLVYSWTINELAVAITYIMMDKELPLVSATEVIKGYHAEFPLQQAELDILYYLVAARLCISVCQSAYGKTIKPDSEYVTISEKAAWGLLKKWIRINPLRAQKTFWNAAGYSWKPKIDRRKLFEQRNAHLSSVLSLSYKEPIAMQGAAFQYMYDTSGNTFLDAYNNIMLAGHCHPYVVEKGQKAMAQLNTNTRYLYGNLNLYAQKLLEKFPSNLNKIFFVNSGSEASDLAIRIAKAHTEKDHVLVLENGYHGSTQTGIMISHYKYASSKGPGKDPSILHTPMPKAFGSGLADDGSCGHHFASKAREIIESSQEKIAAFIAEPVMGCGGQVPLAKSYLKEVYQLVRDQGGICISDEVQVGFGRLGDKFWGFELHDVVPDMVVLGKPMGNGHPIGAVVTSEAIAKSFEKGPEFFSSFGGNPVSCAIGLAVLDVIEEEQLQQSAKQVGDHLKTLLQELQNKYPVIADVRGYGLFLGVELAEENYKPLTELASLLKNKLREANILVGTDGPHQNVLKIKPPLSFDRQNAFELTDEIDRILGEIL